MWRPQSGFQALWALCAPHLPSQSQLFSLLSPSPRLVVPPLLPVCPSLLLTFHLTEPLEGCRRQLHLGVSPCWQGFLSLHQITHLRSAIIAGWGNHTVKLHSPTSMQPCEGREPVKPHLPFSRRSCGWVDEFLFPFWFRLLLQLHSRDKASLQCSALTPRSCESGGRTHRQLPAGLVVSAGTTRGAFLSLTLTQGSHCSVLDWAVFCPSLGLQTPCVWGFHLPLAAATANLGISLYPPSLPTPWIFQVQTQTACPDERAERGAGSQQENFSAAGKRQLHLMSQGPAPAEMAVAEHPSQPKRAFVWDEFSVLSKCLICPKIWEVQLIQSMLNTVVGNKATVEIPQKQRCWKDKDALRKFNLFHCFSLWWMQL